MHVVVQRKTVNANKTLITVTQHFWEQAAVCSERTVSPQLRAKQGLQSLFFFVKGETLAQRCGFEKLE